MNSVTKADVSAEKLVTLTVEEIAALRLMLRVDLVYKTQATMAGTLKGTLKEAIRVVRENPESLSPQAIEVVGDTSAQELAGTVSDYVEDWNTLDHPLVRGMEISGYVDMATAPSDARIPLFLSQSIFDRLKTVIHTGFYNAIKTTNMEQEAASDTGVGMAQALMRNRAAIVEAFKTAEVTGETVSAGNFYSIPAPKGALRN